MLVLGGRLAGSWSRTIQPNQVHVEVAPYRKLSPEQTALFAAQTAKGLDLCHQQNLFHGLLKPSNLMVANVGGQANVAKVVEQLVKTNKTDAVVSLLNVMKDRQTAKVLGLITETNPQLAAELSDRIKRLKSATAKPAVE